MFLVKLGFEQMLRASEPSGDMQAWFEGFAHGLHEAGHLNDDELTHCINLCKEVCGGRVDFVP